MLETLSMRSRCGAERLSAAAFASLAAALIALAAVPLHAAVLTWHAKVAPPGRIRRMAQARGTPSYADWWNGAPCAAWVNDGSSSAVFGAGSGTAGTVSVATYLWLQDLTFNPPVRGS